MCDREKYDQVQFLKLSSVETSFHETVPAYLLFLSNYRDALLSFEETRSRNYNPF